MLARVIFEIWQRITAIILTMTLVKMLALTAMNG
jgi:hypothetical protein